MPRANGDPEEIRNFSNRLEHYLNTVDEETSRLNSAFARLGESWNDPQRASFEETYRQLIRSLQIFKKNASEQIPHLRKMANDLNTYLKR